MRDALEKTGTSLPVATNGTQQEEKVIWVRRDRLAPDPRQPRNWFDEAKLEELAKSIGAVGQRVAIIVVAHPEEPDRYLIVDGERRWRACEIAGVMMMKAVVSQETDERELFKQSAIANFSREGHTTLEIMHAIARIKQDFPDLKNHEIAAMFGKSLGWVQNHLALLRLPREVQDLMHPSRPKEQRLVFSVALQLVPLSEQDQLRFAREYCSGRRSAKSTAVDITRHRLTSGGVTVKKPKKSHARQKITNFTKRIQEDTELIALMDPETFQVAFAGRNRQEVKEALRNLEDAERNIAKIKRLLGKS